MIEGLQTEHSHVEILEGSYLDENENKESIIRSIKQALSQPSCRYCEIVFASKHLYDAHMEELHRPDPNNPNFYCQSCNYKFKNCIMY